MRVGRTQLGSRRALLGVGALVLLILAGVLVAFGVAGGSKTVTLPTTGAYAAISVPKPIIPNAQNGAVLADPDSMIRQGQDLQMILAPDGAGHRYKLTVTNVSGIGAINSFNWFPPNGVQITKVVGSTAGTCEATGTGGFGGNQFGGLVANPEIDCTAVNLKAPTCTCKGDGGRVVITFVANENFGLSGAARITDATPQLKIIPSYAQTPDEPTCASGQTSTKADPCTSG